ncbi:MAG TPA: hypothetical protein VFN21_12915 [Acidimicrobiales bacterium]|nr:hypothetical protein [Acidimicrobiales bacterium]
MGNSRSTFAKNERDRNKKARKAAKIEKRLTKPDEEDELEIDSVQPVSGETQEVIIEKLRILHEDFENEKIDDESFEEAKAELLARLAVV